MKSSLLLIMLILLQSIVAQETYTSPYTQHFPSEIVEALERVITINERTISIETEIDDSTTDIQVLYITSFKLNEKDQENLGFTIVPPGMENFIIKLWFQKSRSIF